ncbi:MAG: hypothetical protein WC966_01650 [Bradymonadales bacterium]|jgi:hypothetical protein
MQDTDFKPSIFLTAFAFVIVLLALIYNANNAQAACILDDDESMYLYYYLYDYKTDLPDDFGQSIRAQKRSADASMAKLCELFLKELHINEKIRSNTRDREKIAFPESLAFATTFATEALNAEDRRDAEFIRGYTMLFDKQGEENGITILQNIVFETNSPITDLIELLQTRYALNALKAPSLLKPTQNSAAFKSLAYWLNAQIHQHKAKLPASRAAYALAFQHEAWRYVAREFWLKPSLSAALYSDNIEVQIERYQRIYGETVTVAALNEVLAEIVITEYGELSPISLITALVILENESRSTETYLELALEHMSRIPEPMRGFTCDKIFAHWPPERKFPQLVQNNIILCLESWRHDTKEKTRRASYELIKELAPQLMQHDDWALYTLSLLSENQYTEARIILENLKSTSIINNDVRENLVTAINKHAPILFSNFKLNEAFCISDIPSINFNACNICDWIDIAHKHKTCSFATMSAKITLDISTCRTDTFQNNLLDIYTLSSRQRAKAYISEILTTLDSLGYSAGILSFGIGITHWNEKHLDFIREDFKTDLVRLISKHAILALSSANPKFIIESSRAILKLCPDSPYHSKLLLATAIALQKLGNESESLQYLERIYNDYPQDPLAHFSIKLAIDILEKNKKNDEIERLKRLREMTLPFP